MSFTYCIDAYPLPIPGLGELLLVCWEGDPVIPQLPEMALKWAINRHIERLQCWGATFGNLMRECNDTYRQNMSRTQHHREETICTLTTCTFGFMFNFGTLWHVAESITSRHGRPKRAPGLLFRAFCMYSCRRSVIMDQSLLTAMWKSEATTVNCDYIEPSVNRNMSHLLQTSWPGAALRQLRRVSKIFKYEHSW